MAIRFITTILIILTFSQIRLFSQSKLNSKIELQMFDTLFHLKEVKERNNYIIKESRGKRQLSALLYKRPEETKNGVYWIKIVEDNGSSMVTHFNFFVYPKSGKIVYFDTFKNQEIELKDRQNIFE